ncbi:DUF2333 family protein [Proteobacteria bacterium 005FR1]|nr:DUF2333 family protein [Proteobacteria bacterium 005FR1]
MVSTGARKTWIGIRRFFRDQSAELSDDLRRGGPAAKVVAIGALGLFLVLIFLGIYWSRSPEVFDVDAATRAEMENLGREPVTGAVTTVALIQVAETLLDKPGGYLTNDITPPGLLLDNMPSWEFGVLVQVRDLSKAMRESFSRSQSQSIENEALAKAEPRFNFDNDSWALPASESEYRDGIGYLHIYLVRLTDPQQNRAQFFSRADNLRSWLTTVETRLGSLSQRLSASVGQRRLNTDLAGDGVAVRATPAPVDELVKTPWLEVDDVFFEARGSAWALLHFLRAVDRDFAQVLQNKNARVSLQQIIRELEATQQPMYSPMVLNGSGFGVFANHSLVMASYISRAHAALADLRALLAQG